jgi:hypothetical protein
MLANLESETAMNRKAIYGGTVLGLLVSLSFVFVVRGIPYLFRGVSDTTRYSAGYSEGAFESVREGMTEVEVTQLLGQPIKTHAGNPGVVRWYGPPGSWVGEDSGLHTPEGTDFSKSAIIRFDLDGRIAHDGPWPGRSADAIQAMLGPPVQEKTKRSVVYWQYSISPPDASYHRRWIGFDVDGHVAERIAFFWWD